MVAMRYRRVFLVLIFFSLVSSWGNAQDEIVIASNPGIESELSIAINPNESSQLVATSMRSFSPIQIFHSEDAGLSWQASSFNDGLADPVLTYGDNGTAYITYLDFGGGLELLLGTSTDNGANWTTQQLTLDGLPADRQWIRRDNSPGSPFYGNTYIGYFHPSGGFDIHIVKIAPDGTVGTNHSVQSTNYPFVQNVTLDVNGNGDVLVCFLSQHADDSFNIMSVSSVDGSENFSTETLVAPIYMYDTNGNPLSDVVGFAPGPASRLGNSLQMAIDKSDGPHAGRVYLTWTDFVAGNPSEGMNIYLSHSDDNGFNWSTPKLVNDDGVASSHQYYSAITVNSNGVLVLSWYDRRADPVNDAITDFYMTYSLDGGASFANSKKLNSASSDHAAVTTGQTTFGVGEYTSVAASKEFAFAVWADGRGNNGDMDVYLGRVKLPESFVIGDVNGDGNVDLLDVAPFVELLGSGKFNAAADINGDGNVDLLDVAPFVSLLGN